MKKKMLAWLLALAMIFTSMPMTADATEVDPNSVVTEEDTNIEEQSEDGEDASEGAEDEIDALSEDGEQETGDGTSTTNEWYDANATEYVINSKDDLLAFADTVNGGEKFAGKVVKLAADIDLAEVEWSPIGGDSIYFAGEFDGQGKTISNLTQTKGARMGLFGMVEKSYIHNLKFKNVDFTVSENSARVGAIAGNLQYWNVVEDVIIDGINITLNGNDGLVGTVTGYAWKSQLGNVDVKNAVFTVNGTGNVIGGNTGYGRAHVWDTGVKGNNAHWLDGTVQIIDGTEYVLQNYFVDCDVDGIKMTLNGTGTEAGGFFGSDTYNSHSNYFVNCHVTGLDVDCKEGTSQTVGGFIAWNNGTTSAGTVKGFDGCSASGTIKGANGIYGGFAGQVGGRACEYNNASADVDIASTGTAGGFVGATQAYSTHKYTFNNCAASGDAGGKVAGGFVGKNGMSGNGKSVYVELNGCSASGSVKGTDIAGGLIGEVNTELPATNWNIVDSAGALTLTGNTAAKDVNGPEGKTGALIGYLDGVANGDAKEGNTVKVTLENNTPENGINVSEDTIKDDITVKSSVALVKGETYESLKDAVAAANAVEGVETIEILSNVTLFESVTIDTDVILDLNGKTITTAKTEDEEYIDAFIVLANVEVIDETGEGSVDARPSRSYAFYVGEKSADENAAVGNLTITNGKFYGDTSVAQVSKGSLTVNGGYFEATEYENAHEFTLNCWDTNYENGTAKIEIKGGTFYKFNPENNAAEGKGTDFVAIGYYDQTAEDDTYTVEETKEWIIDNATELFRFAKVANSGLNFLGIKVVLANDIDLEGATWTPIKSFAGNFVGNNKTISNFHIDATAGNAGFFNSIEGSNGLEDVKVENLTLSDVTATVGNYRFGTLVNSIAGVVHNVTVKNVNVTTTHSTAWVGGMAAFMSWPWMTNCTVENMTVDATKGAEFVAGFACILQKNSNHVFDNLDVNGFKVTVKDTDGSCGVAGFVGQTQRGWENPKVINSDVKGIDITATGTVDIGGFIAWPGAHTITDNCTAEGKIDATGIGEDNFAGGFFGNLGWNADLGQKGHNVTNCTADVDIRTKVAPAGGFVGSATNSNNSSMYAEFVNCTAKGDITCVDGGTASVGGFAGDADRGVYTNCTAEGKVTGQTYAGGFVGHIIDVTPKYDSRYPVGTRNYDVDEITIEECDTEKTTVVGANGKTAGIVGYKDDGTKVTTSGNKWSEVLVEYNPIDVAQIGDVKYTSIAKAVEAAKAIDGVETIEILSNVTLSESVTIDTDVILDLNGKTITTAETEDEQYIDAFIVLANVEVIDETGEGSVDARPSRSYAFYVGEKSADENAAVGNLIVTNGKFYGDTSVAQVSKGSLIVNGGYFEATEYEKAHEFTLNCWDTNYKNGTAKIEIKGGTFYKFNPENNAAEGKGTDFVAIGYYDQTAEDDTYTVKETEDWIIDNETELFRFAKTAKNGFDFSGIKVTLANDLDLEGTEWEAFHFYGTLDGGNHTIKNLTYKPMNGTNQMGFFNSLYGKVENLTLDGIKATVPNGGQFGSLARRTYGATTTNVHVKNIEVKSSGGAANIGGFVYYADNSSITDCSVENYVVDASAGAEYVAGFYVMNNDSRTYTNCDVKNVKITLNAGNIGSLASGFVCQTQIGWNAPKFVDCDVTGIDITVTGWAGVAGFIAWPGAHTTITNCTTEGKIDATGLTLGSQISWAGGFLGNLGWNCDLGQKGHVVTDCTADVDVETKLVPAGGFVGSATNSNNRSMYAEFTNCTAKGNITCVDGGTASVGGFAGDADRGVYTNCTAEGKVTGQTYAGGFVGHLIDNNKISYDYRYPAGTREYLVDEITVESCTALNTVAGAKGKTAGIIGYKDPTATVELKDNKWSEGLYEYNPMEIAQVGDVKYTDLKEAIEACTDGETVVLLTDITYEEADVVPAHGGATGFGKYDASNPSIIYLGGTKGASAAENQPSNVKAVIDLNGHTITNNADAYLFLIMDNAKITFKDSSEDKSGAVVSTTEWPVLWVTGAETLVTINGGNYTTANDEGLIWSTHSGDLVINDGEFMTTADDASLLIMINTKTFNNPNYFLEGVATSTVSGGTFYGFNPEKTMDDNTDPFTETNTVVPGYAAYEVEDNVWTVNEESVARIGKVFYETLDAAIKAVKENEVIVVVKDCSESIVIVPANVTLDLNGKTIDAGNVLAFGTVIDTAKEVGGIKISNDTTKAFVQLQPENGEYLPIYDTAEGCYRFFKFEVVSAGYKTETNAVKFGFKYVFVNKEAYKVLADTTDSAVDYCLELNWTGLIAPINYKMSVDTIKGYAEAVYKDIIEKGSSGKALTFKVTGVSNLNVGDEITAKPYVESLTGVTKASDQMSYTVE